MQITLLLVIGFGALSVALTPAQISQKMDKMENIALQRCLKKAEMLQPDDGVHIASPSSRFQDIIKGIDEINGVIDDIASTLGSPPSTYNEADSTVILKAYSSFITQFSEFWVVLHQKGAPFVEQLSTTFDICNAVHGASTNNMGKLYLLLNPLMNKLATSDDRDLLTRITVNFGTLNAQVRSYYCTGRPTVLVTSSS